MRVPRYGYRREGAISAAGAGPLPDCPIEMGLGKKPCRRFCRRRGFNGSPFGVERVLIVCPTSLKHQWARAEIEQVDRSRRLDRVSAWKARRRGTVRHRKAFTDQTNYDTISPRDLENEIRIWFGDSGSF